MILYVINSLLIFFISHHLYTLSLPSFFFFFFNDPAPPEISPLSLHDALPILARPSARSSSAWTVRRPGWTWKPAKSVPSYSMTRAKLMRSETGVGSMTAPTSPASRSSRVGARSEEHTSELQSLAYLVCRLLLE